MEDHDPEFDAPQQQNQESVEQHEPAPIQDNTAEGEGAKPERKKRKKKKKPQAAADAQLNLPPIIDPSRASQNLILDAAEDSGQE